jgi:NitT/TauT family transport system ATP-binding protein
MASKVLELRRVHVRFRAKNGTDKALDDISFQVNRGEFVSIVGPSGCGKSTLLSVISGLLPATIGKIDIKNKAVGFVFQEPNLLPWRTVMGNVMLPMEIRKKADAANERKALGLLNLVGLAHCKDSFPHELSGGMKQKVSIVRALMTEPALLLMDEPTNSLDEIARTQFNIELNKIWRKTRKTIVYVTHSIPEAVFLSTKVIVLTPCPGKVKKIIDIGLPAVRNEAVLSSKRYFGYVNRVREVLRK